MAKIDQKRPKWLILEKEYKIQNTRLKACRTLGSSFFVPTPSTASKQLQNGPFCQQKPL